MIGLINHKCVHTWELSDGREARLEERKKKQRGLTRPGKKAAQKTKDRQGGFRVCAFVSVGTRQETIIIPLTRGTETKRVSQ
jgi:hypothetical protein